MFFLSHCCQGPFPCWESSPPHLPRMPSSTVLISGPTGTAAQILTWSYSCVFLPPMSTASELVRFLWWLLSMSFYIFHRHSLPS